MSLYANILEAQKHRRRLFAVLLDLEKTSLEGLNNRTRDADYVLVGGSTGANTAALVRALHRQTDKPVILFPGNVQQFCPEADALLFLSVLSSRNADCLIGQHVAAARTIAQSGVETIPTGYILIDGGKRTAVMDATQSEPIRQTDIRQAVDTAIAAELLGKRLIYLEAGSGALTPVSEHLIRAVREAVSLPLMVGGGIRTPQMMNTAYNAGADIVVVGNHLEQHPEEIELFGGMRR
ncbi:MAG: phosphoglycerol geranylgeranyltransferase [Paludibacteraceae bacterium]|nr:phosphoglycerol geranylgeranyltransferase [Paludibacteraceae bacterium]